MSAMAATITDINSDNQGMQQVLEAAMAMGQEQDDNNSVMSQLTALQATQTCLEKQNMELKALVAAMKNKCALASVNEGGVPNLISDDSTKKPTKKLRTKKRFPNNNNCFWTHGYDLRDPRHTSKTCQKPRDGHIRSHTGTNPAKGAGKKFHDLSIYKDILIPE